MEYCDGGTLHSLISGVDLNEGQIANVLGKVLPIIKAKGYISVAHTLTKGS